MRQTLGAVLLEAGRPGEAEVVYWEYLKSNRENGWSLFGLAQALRGQGRTEAAKLVEREFRRFGLNFNRMLKGGEIKPLANEIGYRSEDDLLAAVEMQVRQRRFGRAVRVEVDAGMPVAVRERGPLLAGRQDQSHPCVAAHELQPGGGISRIEGQPGGPGLEGAEQAHHHLQRRPRAQAHHLLVAHDVVRAQNERVVYDDQPFWRDPWPDPCQWPLITRGVADVRLGAAQGRPRRRPIPSCRAIHDNPSPMARSTVHPAEQLSSGAVPRRNTSG